MHFQRERHRATPRTTAASTSTTHRLWSFSTFASANVSLSCHCGHASSLTSTAAPAVPPPRPLISRASAHNLKADLLCGSHDSCRTCFRPAFACEVSSLPSLELQASARIGTPLPILTSPFPYQKGCTFMAHWCGVWCPLVSPCTVSRSKPATACALRSTPSASSTSSASTPAKSGAHVACESRCSGVACREHVGLRRTWRRGRAGR